MTVRFYSSVAPPKNLAASITNATTLIQLSDTIGLPTQFPFTLALDYDTPIEELVDVTNLAGVMATVVRGVDSTTATSHTAGAVVRHVSSARDFTDSRNHENSSTNVHGTAVGSAVVGTTDTQTLTNKTLSGATVTGTSNISGTQNFTGTATFSGVQSFTTNTSFTAEIDHSGVYKGVRPSAGSEQAETRVAGDAFARWVIDADGTQSWGLGNAAQDVSVGRVNPGDFFINGTATVSNFNTSPTASHLRVAPSSPDPASKLLDVRSGAQTVLSSNGQGTTTVAPLNGTNANGLIVNLPVASTGHVAEYQVVGNTVAVMDNTGTFIEYQNNTPISYTPVLTGGGTASFSTIVGWYYRIGKMIQVYAYFAASNPGSGTATITISLPSVPFRDGAGVGTTRQFIPIHGGGIAAGSNSSVPGSFSGVILAGSTGAQVDNLFGPTEVLLRGDNIGAGTVITLEGWYRES